MFRNPILLNHRMNNSVTSCNSYLVHMFQYQQKLYLKDRFEYITWLNIRFTEYFNETRQRLDEMQIIRSESEIKGFDNFMDMVNHCSPIFRHARTILHDRSLSTIFLHALLCNSTFTCKKIDCCIMRCNLND